MQHEPHGVLGIKAHLDEVVSAAKRPELLHRLRFTILNAWVEMLEAFPCIPRV
jgi:hypothetical protein